jgi:hypothetical protein
MTAIFKFQHDVDYSSLSALMYAISWNVTLNPLSHFLYDFCNVSTELSAREMKVNLCCANLTGLKELAIYYNIQINVRRLCNSIF